MMSPEAVNTLLEMTEDRTRLRAEVQRLREACQGLEDSLAPYRGEGSGPDATYLCSRAAVAAIRSATADTKGGGR